MDSRAAEVERLAGELGVDARAFLRSALALLKKGELHNAALNIRRVLELENKPFARWAALLVALDAAELRLGGAARFTTPERRYVLEIQGDLYPEGEHLDIELRLVEKPGTSSIEWDVRELCGDSRLEWVDEVIRTLADEIEAHLGLSVELVDRGA